MCLCEASLCDLECVSVFGNEFIGPSVLRAPAEQTKVATVLGTFLLVVVVTTVIQNHRRGCRIVSNFCMGP